MKSENTLAVVAILFVGLIGGLFFSFLWKSGADLDSSTSAKNWIELCSRGNEDVYCKTARKLTSKINKPFIFIHPNKGDRILNDDIARSAKEFDIDLTEIVESNIFLGDTLSSGTRISLNGDQRTFICGANDPNTCSIEGITVNLLKHFENSGAIYTSSNHFTDRKNIRYDFLLPRK